MSKMNAFMIWCNGLTKFKPRASFDFCTANGPLRHFNTEQEKSWKAYLKKLKQFIFNRINKLKQTL